MSDCPKCGSHAAAKYVSVAGRESLQYNCNCGYSWSAPTKDATKTESVNTGKQLLNENAA